MDDLGPDQIRFRLHPPMHDDEEVSADVFAAKLGILVRALKYADRAVNGKAKHDYKIARLSSSSPTALIAERLRPTPYDWYGDSHPSSGIEAFDRCAKAVVAGDRETARRYGGTAGQIDSLARGAAKKFSYAEVWVSDDIIRVDPFLKERAAAVIAPVEEDSVGPVDKRGWYRGTVHASFDGVVKEVDLRGALPEIKLILSAGKKEIDCVCREDALELIRAGLDRRVRLAGMATYDGKSGLPRRIQVTSIELVQGGNFSDWKGAFEPFDIPDWEADAD